MASSSNEHSQGEHIAVSLDVEIVIGSHDDNEDDSDDVDILVDHEDLDVDLDDEDEDEEDDNCDEDEEDEEEVAALMEIEEERMMEMEEDDMIDSFHSDTEAEEDAGKVAREVKEQREIGCEGSGENNQLAAGAADETDSGTTQQHFSFARARARTFSIDIDREFRSRIPANFDWRRSLLFFVNAVSLLLLFLCRVDRRIRPR